MVLHGAPRCAVSTSAACAAPRARRVAFTPEDSRPYVCCEKPSKCYKFSLEHVHFEVNVVSMHRNGVNMGDIGHSVAQIHTFRNAFWEETMICVRRFIADQSCVTLIAD